MIGSTAVADDKRPGRFDWRLWLPLIVGMAAVLRFGVADHSLWFDEQASVFFSDQPFARLWSDWMLRETNPALYYSVLRAWRAIFGSTDLTIRALSVIASLVAIVLVFAVARRLYGAGAGLIAATLAALSGQQLYFAEQARGYIFVFVAALVAIDALLTFAIADERAARWRSAVIYAVAATGAIYLHTTMLLFPAIAFAAVIAVDPRRYAKRPALLLPLLAVNVAVLLAVSWAIRQAVLQVLHHSQNIAPVRLAGGRQLIFYPLQTLFLSGSAGKISDGLALLVLMLALAFTVLDWRRRETRLIAVIGILALAVFALLGTVVPVFVQRTLFWMSAVPLILTAGMLARIPFRLRAAILVVLLGLLVFDTGRVVAKLEQEDWNTPVRLAARRPDTLMLVQGEAMAVLADSVCRRRLGKDVCPYTVVEATDPLDRYDTWAQGTFAGPKVPVTSLPSYARGRPVFLFRKAIYHDLPETLHLRGLGHGVPADGPPLLGPLPGTALR